MAKVYALSLLLALSFCGQDVLCQDIGAARDYPLKSKEGLIDILEKAGVNPISLIDIWDQLESDSFYWKDVDHRDLIENMLTALFETIDYNERRISSSHVLKRLKEFVGEDSANGRLVMSEMARAILYSIPDERTGFYEPGFETGKLMLTLSGRFISFGFVYGFDENGALVVTKLLDEKIGFSIGDEIIIINGRLTSEMTRLDIINYLTPTSFGQELDLVVLMKDGEKKSFHLGVKILKQKNLSFVLLGDNTLFLSIKSFNDGTVEWMVEMYDVLVAEDRLSGIKNVILDLRGNPGGLVSVARYLVSFFVGPGKVYFSEINSRGEKSFFLTAPHEAKIKPEKIIILANRMSASSSEISIGALKVHAGAVLIGEKTYGKGTVQSLVENELGIFVFTSHFWNTPDGKNIDGVGFNPDYVAVRSGMKDSALRVALALLNIKVN